MSTDLAGRFRALRGRPLDNAADASMFISLCESFWSSLDQGAAADLHADDFVALLDDDDRLRLASNVIPEFRAGPHDPLTPAKGDIIRRVNPQRLHTQPPTIPPPLAGERAILHDADLQRIWIHMCQGCEVLDDEKRRELLVWLQSCPIRGDVQGSPGGSTRRSP
ncbi:hypothetical protein DM02DRAFT_627908 [Periconia macrospinosa]|uniref:Uncharacterized protein n=1 Tax=Periconia macrospinosa TaxID=97972 RepID=A0A2V1DSN7_9PLEO|nr:hypothetical protein DM02DRAFT_627908 [Periconia macrospinosa]